MCFALACASAVGVWTWIRAGHPISQATRAPKPVPAPTQKGAIYPYSVIPGGVYTRHDFAAAFARDPVVRSHYFDVSPNSLTAEVVTQPVFRYVSFRKNERVYWTRRPVRIAAGETILTTGVAAIRARCGNRLSEGPRQPVLPNVADEPAESDFERPTAEQFPREPSVRQRPVRPPMLVAGVSRMRSVPPAAGQSGPGTHTASPGAPVPSGAHAGAGGSSEASNGMIPLPGAFGPGIPPPAASTGTVAPPLILNPPPGFPPQAWTPSTTTGVTYDSPPVVNLVIERPRVIVPVVPSHVGPVVTPSPASSETPVVIGTRPPVETAENSTSDVKTPNDTVPDAVPTPEPGTGVIVGIGLVVVVLKARARVARRAHDSFR